MRHPTLQQHDQKQDNLIRKCKECPRPYMSLDMRLDMGLDTSLNTCLDTCRT